MLYGITPLLLEDSYLLAEKLGKEARLVFCVDEDTMLDRHLRKKSIFFVTLLLLLVLLLVLILSFFLFLFFVRLLGLLLRNSCLSGSE